MAAFLELRFVADLVVSAFLLAACVAFAFILALSRLSIIAHYRTEQGFGP